MPSWLKNGSADRYKGYDIKKHKHDVAAKGLHPLQEGQKQLLYIKTNYIMAKKGSQADKNKS